MFRSRSFQSHNSTIQTIKHRLDGFGYKVKWSMVVLIVLMLSLSNIPQLFAEQVQQTTKIIITRTGKRYRVVTLDTKPTSTRDVVKTKSKTKSTSLGFNTTGSLSPYTGTGSCIWSMADMYRTGLQTYTGDYGSGGLLSGEWSLDTTLYSGSWSGFDSQVMILLTHTGIMMHDILAHSNHYLAMNNCIRSSGLITYPTQSQYLSGLVMMTGELRELPSVFTGVGLIDEINSLHGTSSLPMITQVRLPSNNSNGARDVGLRGGAASITTSKQRIVEKKERAIGTRKDSINTSFSSSRVIIIRSNEEFVQLIDENTIIALRQTTIRARDMGAINKLQLTQDIIYESDDAIITADLKADTTIFTAQGQELKSNEVVVDRITQVPKDGNPHKPSDFRQEVVQFGTPGDHLIFTKPVQLRINSNQPDGTRVNISVKHGDDSFTVQGLSTDPSTTCDYDGNTSIPSSQAIVQGGQITVYTCGASIFTFTYIGGPSFTNFIDNGSLTKTVMIATGSVATGFKIQNMQVVVDFQSIDSEDPTNFSNTNAHPNENSFTITSPGGTTRTLLATNTYTSGSADRAVLTFDDSALGSPSGLPTSGAFVPNESLSIYNGTSPIGTWILTMSDSVGQDGVILHGFDVIVQQSVCGDNTLDIGEQCDDGNKTSGDGCNKFCKIEYACGDGDVTTMTTTIETFVNEDFESIGNATLSSNTIITSTPGYILSYENTGSPARARYGTDAIHTNGGSGAITLDVSSNSIYQTNYIIIEADLSDAAGSTNIDLSFDFSDHSDEVHDDDKVWIRGSNSSAWLQIYDRGSNGINGTYQSVTELDIDELLASFGQVPTSTFQVRFGQYDDLQATRTTATDGVSFDNIVIRGGVSSDTTLEEQCDDSNTSNGDGCSHSCQIEPGRQCSGNSCSRIPDPSGLIFHLDGSVAGGLFTDISGNGNSASNVNGSTTGSTNGETIMCFNGTNQYLERVANLTTSYPFTMSVWMSSNTVSGLRGVMSFARSTVGNTMYNIEHNASTIRQRSQNTTATYNNALTELTTTDWFLVTAVYQSDNSRDIYINGVYESTDTLESNYDSNTDKRLNIGRFADSSPANYFNGCVDDVRFYNSALISSQIYQLYARSATLNTSLVSTGSPLLTGTISSPLDRIILTISGKTYTGTNNGNGTWSLASGIISPALASGTRNITLNVINPYNRSVSYNSSFVVSSVTIPLGTLSIYTPGLLTLTGSVDNTGNVVEMQFDYFTVDDRKGINSGYYTTISVSTLSGAGGSSISNAQLQWKGDPITVLSGAINPRVVVSTGIQSYITANSVTTFIKRDTATNSSVKGEYGSKLWVKATIPAYQRPGTYSGTITYTLYEN